MTTTRPAPETTDALVYTQDMIDANDWIELIETRFHLNASVAELFARDGLTIDVALLATTVLVIA